MNRLPLLAALALLSSAVVVVETQGREPRASQSAAAPQDLLEAQASGLVDVKFIPNDSRSAQVVVTNRSNRPLTLRLPAGFAGVPVLAQFMNQQQGGAGFGAGGIGGVPQNVGGGGGQNAGMNIGGQGGGGPFSLPPERTKTLRIATVCLEHGKREPSPRIEYRMESLATTSSDPRLQDVVSALADGRISQKVAQAAAWHISSGRSWEQLEAEMIVMAGGDPDVPFFLPAELAAARRLVDVTTSRHPAAPPAVSDSAAR
ncbi:MAG: hypothetical protein K8S94_00780 [Planctomycetia bacterium]|nr:hypothetical protein [Planctomycetia bacterium]